MGDAAKDKPRVLPFPVKPKPAPPKPDSGLTIRIVTPWTDKDGA